MPAVGTMKALKRNVVILGLGCLAAAIHIHYCEWETGAFAKRRAVFGLNKSPNAMMRDLFARDIGRVRGPEEGWSNPDVGLITRPTFLSTSDYACGIAAAQDLDVKIATILGVLLPLGLLFVAFDIWIGRPRLQAAVKAVSYRLRSGHWATVYETCRFSSGPA